MIVGAQAGAHRRSSRPVNVVQRQGNKEEGQLTRKKGAFGETFEAKGIS